jgi:16S rRNA (adenine1518-N6/adenine1519-N6)-dimethyltransferase
LYGYLSVATQFYSRPEFALKLPRGAFRPPPEVGSALVTLRFPGERGKLGIPDERAFLDFVKNCFAQKRKTLTNNLRALVPPDQLRAILKNLQLREDARAEQLTVTLFAGLYQAISSAPIPGGRDSRS